MKVLMVAAASSVHVVRWANAFVARGLQVHLVSQHAPAPGFDMAVVLHRLPHLFGAGYVLNRFNLRRIVRNVRPDVINAHYASGYGTLAVYDAKAPLVLNIWGSDVYDFPDAGLLQRWLVRKNLRRADKVVSTSEAMARRTAEVCPGLGRIIVVPFGVDSTLFHPTTPGAHASGAITIGTVKALTPVYGVDILIKAFALLRRTAEGGDTRLRIAGGGRQEAELRRLAKHLGVGASVHFVGRLPHERVPDELRQLDIFAALSREESFGVAVIEASSCGLPVVVSDAGGLPEVVQHGVTGAVVRRDDPEAAAEQLRSLVSSAELRRKWGAAGRARVIERFEWSACVDRMVNVLEEARKARSSR